MNDNYYDRIEHEAVEELEELLARPTAPSGDLIGVIDEVTNKPEYFNPWDILPVYGNYSSEFDDMALKVLKNLLAGNREEETLAHEIFREILCEKGLCDYGTSPRVCFPSSKFKEMLPVYIDKWIQYYKLMWEVER